MARSRHIKNFLQKLLMRISKSVQQFCRTTSVHGFNQIAMKRRHWSERVLWTCITCVAMWAAVSVSVGQLQRYNDSPTVVTLEKDFRQWRFSLPAVTACYEKRVDPEKLLKSIKSRWNVTPNDTNYEYYQRFVSTVANSDLFHLEDYDEFKDDKSLDVDLFQIAVEVMPDLMMRTSSSQPKSLNWSPVMTESGVCFTTNSVAIADIVLTKQVNLTEGFPVDCEYAASVCYVIFEVSKTAHFYIHSPCDVAKTTERPSTIYPSLNRFTELSVTETKTGHGVRLLTPKRRACRYVDESTSGKLVYSTQMCRLSCRSKLALKLCGCRPFYYFYEEGPPCGVSGMRCLSGHSRELANFGGVKCGCASPCLHAEFKENVVEDQIWGKGPFQERGALRYSVQAPRTRYTREIVFHFEDLVVSFGGAAGLFLGASFISFVEIVYFVIEKIINLFTKDEKPVVKQKSPFEKQIQNLNLILQTRKF